MNYFVLCNNQWNSRTIPLVYICVASISSLVELVLWWVPLTVYSLFFFIFKVYQKNKNKVYQIISLGESLKKRIFEVKGPILFGSCNGVTLSLSQKVILPLYQFCHDIANMKKLPQHCYHFPSFHCALYLQGTMNIFLCVCNFSWVYFLLVLFLPT